MTTAVEIDGEVTRAQARIAGLVRRTWLEPSPVLSELTGAGVHLKLENLQQTGSFKARGALNTILSLDGDERARGVVAASTGNHGAAVAWAARAAGCAATVFVPENAAATKLAAIERLGAAVERAGGDCVESERTAREVAGRDGRVYLSPYNDLRVVAGQGTIAAELLEQLGDIDVVFASLGGGGLLSGIGAVLAARSPSTRVVGVSPERSPVMIESVRAGEILDLPSQPTLSDGSAGGVEEGSITFPLVRDLVHDYVTVSEREIAEGMRFFIDNHHMLIEGAAAAVVAGLMLRQVAGRRVVVVLCGGNIGTETLAAVLGAPGSP